MLRVMTLAFGKETCLVKTQEAGGLLSHHILDTLTYPKSRLLYPHSFSGNLMGFCVKRNKAGGLWSQVHPLDIYLEPQSIQPLDLAARDQLTSWKICCFGENTGSM